MRVSPVLAIAMALGAALSSGCGVAPPAAPEPLVLESCRPPGVEIAARCGAHQVWENRSERRGRRLTLDVVVLRATGSGPRGDPIFFIAGGPGQSTTEQAGWLQRSPLVEHRDIVLVDQRGTAGDHRLDCDLPGSSENPQGYLDAAFEPEVFRPCVEKLSAVADLTRYSTPIAMDDLDEVRSALGYDRINLIGGSYGTRASLVYMRRHPRHVRTAVLNGVAPLAFTNPLFHAREAQHALELLFEECAASAPCAAAFPDLAGTLERVFDRLAEEPAKVEIELPGDDGGRATLELSRDAFAEALRVMLYSGQRNRQVPRLIYRAAAGDLEPFAKLALLVNRGLHDSLRHGMLLAVACAEDVARIDPAEIARETEGTFLGDRRVRGQMAVCDLWPQGEIPENYGDPVTADVPTLVLSGSLDPVTSPRWGEEAARHLPKSLHVVVPGAHFVRGECVDRMVSAFLEAGTAEGLDTSCVAEIELPPIEIGDA